MFYYQKAKRWFWGPDNSTTCEKISHAAKRTVMDIRREFIEYVIGLIGKGNLDVAAINFTGLGFFHSWLKPDPKLRTPSTEVSFSLILSLIGIRFFQKISGDLLQQAQQKHKEEQLTFCWKWIGKLSNLTRFATNTITGLLYEFSTMAVLGLFFEPGFEWFSLPQEYFPIADSLTIGFGVGKALFYLLDNLPNDWNNFCKTWKQLDVKMQKFTSEEKIEVLTPLELKVGKLFSSDFKKKIIDFLECELTKFVAENLKPPKTKQPLLVN